MTNNDKKTIVLYHNISYRFWFGLFMVSSIIPMVAIEVMDASMIVIDFFLFLYFALDVVTAVCATTANKYTEKNFKINIIATSIRIALFVPLLIAGLIKNASPAVFGMFVLPVINALYLTLTIKVKNITKNVSEDEIEKIQYQKEKYKFQVEEPPTRYSLVKDNAVTFACWKDNRDKDCYIYVMPSIKYNGVFLVEVSYGGIYKSIDISKKYIDYYDFEFFKHEIEMLVWFSDFKSRLNIEATAKEMWRYLKYKAATVEGEVSPEYQERYCCDYIIDGTHSRGPMELYELSVGHVLDRSAVYFIFFGGITGTIKIIDDETVENLTVESLIEWMKIELSDIFTLCNPSKYLKHAGLRDWCKRQSEKAKSKKRSEIIDGPINGYAFEKSIHLGHWGENFYREDVCLVFENPDWYLKWESWEEVHRGACNGGLIKHKVDKEYLTSHNIFSVDDFFDYIYKGNLASCREQIQSKKEVISFLSDLIKSINSPDNNS